MDSLPNLSTATEDANTPAATPAPAASASTSASASTPTDAPAATITGSGTTGDATGAISITAIGTATGGGGLTGLPKISGVIQPVTATVPPTANAPFMQQSSLPDGTVFIIVGAILGFMALSVILWRALVAWSLHRSVKRAALHQTSMADTKALFRAPAPPAPFYSNYSDRESKISLSGLGGGTPGNKKGARSTASGTADRGSLFFSPTAGAAGAGLSAAGNRGSGYLPAGYYPSGTGVASNNNSMQQPGISLSTLRSDSRGGYGRARSSPPESPYLGGAGEDRHMQSSSTLNLSQGYGGNERAPSAYLEDLFDSEGGRLTPPGGGGVRERGQSGSPTPRRY